MCEHRNAACRRWSTTEPRACPPFWGVARALVAQTPADRIQTYERGSVAALAQQRALLHALAPTQRTLQVISWYDVARPWITPSLHHKKCVPTGPTLGKSWRTWCIAFVPVPSTAWPINKKCPGHPTLGTNPAQWTIVIRIWCTTPGFCWWGSLDLKGF